MTRLQHHLAGSVAFAAIAAAAFFWAVADGDQAAQAADVPAAATRAMGAAPAQDAHDAGIAGNGYFDRAKREAKAEELPPQF